MNLDPKVKIKQRLNLKNKSHKFFKLNENKNSKNNIVSFIVSDYNDSDIDYMNYKDAIIFDKRTFGQIYISFLFGKQPILFSFCPKNDYNIFIIKLCLFFLSFAIYYSLNTFFFDLSVIHKIYEDNGEYNLSYHFPQIIFSFLISYYVNNIIKFVTLIERNLLHSSELMQKWHTKNKEDTVSTLLLKWMIFYLYLFNEEEYYIDINNKRLSFRFNEAKYLNSFVSGKNKLSAYSFIDMFDYTYNPGSYMEANSSEHILFKDTLKISIEQLLEGKTDFFHHKINN